MTSMSQLLYFTWVKHIQFNQFHLIPESMSDNGFFPIQSVQLIQKHTAQQAQFTRFPN